jgi:hypothetical protein
LAQANKQVEKMKWVLGKMQTKTGMPLPVNDPIHLAATAVIDGKSNQAKQLAYNHRVAGEALEFFKGYAMPDSNPFRNQWAIGYDR